MLEKCAQKKCSHLFGNMAHASETFSQDHLEIKVHTLARRAGHCILQVRQSENSHTTVRLDECTYFNLVSKKPFGPSRNFCDSGDKAA
mmetsp:Transcript_38737/g.100401  ORF Transcript_38737/g.100401 Transcript_38737/m.100401 type:complete len:88 (-) Transcript_38737:90-353(-)